jgi:two-component system, LytTR family, sensor kinase
VWSRDEIISGIIRISLGVAVAFAIWWLVRHLPWPRPFRVRFVLTHVVAVFAFALAWSFASYLLVSLLSTGGRFPYELQFFTVVLYVFVAGTTYAVEATARAARAEAMSAQTQLAALRAQLHPHFLFNALHTVVQLIPIEPARAMEAAELVADLLRSAIEEQRDEVTLDDEWRFVSRYLAVEQIRFGDRLAVRTEIAPDLLDEHLPSFALQTLVENAVRHGAAPRVAPTEIVVAAAGHASGLTISVRNTGDGKPSRAEAGIGSGLARLRERLAVLYGDAARLTTHPLDDGGFESVLVVPRLHVQGA